MSLAEVKPIVSSPTFVYKPTLEIPVISLDESAKKKNRCELAGCRVKLGLTAFPCRCGHKFCASHRCSEAHMCSYDFHAEAQKLLSSQMSKVTGSKLDKL